MPATEAGTALTASHQAQQAQLAVRTITQMDAAWPLLDPLDLEGTVSRWLRVVVPMVQADAQFSAEMGANYYSMFRGAELGDVRPFVPSLAAPAPAEAIATSLTVTGPLKIEKALQTGLAFEEAIETARAATASAGSRHALNGGRDTIIGGVTSDRQALGYARKTGRPDPCAFCAMLASRGPVYKSERSAKLRADGHRYHDKCWCAVVPVYHRDAPWPDGSERFREVWDEATAGLKGQDAVNAFRRALSAAA